MPRTKYKFNPESLSFDKIRLGYRGIVIRFLAYFIGSVLVAVIYWIIFAAFFDSPKEKALKREVQQMTIQYDLIHREMGNIENVLDDLQKTDDNLYRTIFEAEPIPATLRAGGIGGVNRYKSLEGYETQNWLLKLPTGSIRSGRRSICSPNHLMTLSVLQRKGRYAQSVPAIIPISNKDLTRIASGFG